MRYKYQTFEFGQSDIHVRSLRDRQEFDDPEQIAEGFGISSAQWSLFGVVWESSEVLAHLMWARACSGERILEVGCGLGLTSLALAKRGQNISATDIHPDAKTFMDYNSELNGLAPVHFVRATWNQSQPELGRFDLIVGSDVLYEPSCVDQLSQFILRHAEQQCEVLLVDPDRGWQAKFSNRMRELGFRAADKERVVDPALPGYKGALLRYQRH